MNKIASFCAAVRTAATQVDASRGEITLITELAGGSGPYP
jgi:hypothetical protein